jgi:quercetin dioxygenase-like cupin family protein
MHITRLYADENGAARFQDVEITFTPDDPPPDATSVSEPQPASAVLFARASGGGGHGEQPEHQRQLAIGMSGTAEITASGETRTFGPGDALLIEDTEGVGHSSRTLEGFVAAVVVLAP